jgi:hypothetical protein
MFNVLKYERTYTTKSWANVRLKREMTKPDQRYTTTAPSETVFSEGERNAMRTFLQRTEVRLSTLHRIATAFVGGAGLLLLIPIFFRDVIDSLMIFYLEQFGNLYPQLGQSTGIALSIILFLSLLYPLLLSLAIPLYGVYLLLKDIVHFYFTIYLPGFPQNLLNPTFSLHAIAFSPDESQAAKQEITRFQYQPEHMNFLMAFSEGKRQEYFDNFIKRTKGEIIPRSRRIEALIERDALPEHYDPKEVDRFNAAFGIARSLDRALVEEVAMAEMALVRAVMYLRRLVIRYVKTLLMFIWTTVVAFLMLPFTQSQRYPTLLIVSIGYLVWSVVVLRVIRLPIHWIYRHRLGDVNREHVDAQLTFLERRIEPFCQVAILASIAATLLSLFALLL